MAALGLTPDKGLTPVELCGLIGALDQWLVQELGEMAQPLDLLAVGGAAIALQWDPGRVTDDVDVISDLLPADLWEGAAAVAASREDVRADWLNDAAKIGVLSPQVDAEPALIYDGRNIRVYGASARYVMAMKAVAGRPTDLEDLPGLVEEGRFGSLDEALEWVARAHSHHQVPVAAQYIIESVWAEIMERGSRQTAPAAGHLAVRPGRHSEWGWEVELARADGEPLTGWARYPSMEHALEAADLARELLDAPERLRFEKWEWDWQPGDPGPGDRRLTVVPVPQVGGWTVRVVDPTGESRRVSLPYPTQQDAWAAQSFIANASRALGDPRQRGPVQVRVSGVCNCRQRGSPCRHYGHPAPVRNSMSVSIRPHRDTTQDWEVAVHGVDGSPVLVSSPLPTEEAAAGVRDFALAVANAAHPVRFEGWEPWRWDGPGYFPPSADQAATTVRIKPPPTPQSDVWRLQARRSGGDVLATSPSHPSRQAAADALEFVGALSVLAGDPARAGRVRDTTSDADRTCSCLTLGANCLHYETTNPDTRGPDRGHRGPGIGL